MRPVSDFIDKDGLLDKLYLPDGGDTCQREGMYYALLGMMNNIQYTQWKAQSGARPALYFILKKLHPHPGVLLRHSNPSYDASDWDRMSRDQVQSMVIAMGYWSKEELKRFCKGHLKRGFIFTNNTRKNGATKANHGQFVAGEVRDYSWKLPDFTGPEIWGNIIRGFNNKLLYPLLWITDLELLGGAIKWRFFRKHNIAMNHTLSQLQGLHRMPTLWSWLASKIMPVPKLIELIKDHFNDFPDDMEFFGPMFEHAYVEITNG